MTRADTPMSAVDEARIRELEEKVAALSAQLDHEARQRHAIERDLLEERDFVSTILQSTNALIAVLDTEGRIVRFNAACELASGYTAREVIGRDFWSLGLVPSEEAPAVRHVLPRVRQRGEQVGMENRWRHRDGTESILAWVNAPLCDETGAVRYVVATAVDITRRREAREALRAERDLVEKILETTPAIILVSDRQARIVRFNRAAQMTSGLELAEVEGKDVMDLVFSPAEKVRVRRIFDRVLQGDFPQSAETEWLHRDGSLRRLSWMCSALTDVDGSVKYVIAAAVDITARLEAEARERERLAELAHLHRMHTAGELAAVLAHEINQPLAAIASYSAAGVQAIDGYDDPDGRNRRLFEKIGAAAMRAGKVVRDLRAFVARHAASVSPLDLNASVQSAIELVRGYAGRRGVEIEFVCGELPLVIADAVQVEHILVNLLRNGIEAISGAGMPTGTVRVDLRTEERMAEVIVEDSGPGVAKEEAEHLFSPFYTSKADGLGMGLRISRSLAQANGGRLWVEAREPGGVFHVLLPLAS